MKQHPCAWSNWRCVRSLLVLLLLLLGANLRAAEPAAKSDDQDPLEQRLSAIFAGAAPESLAELRAMEKHQQALIDQVNKCTVAVQVGEAHGSGVIVSEDGLILTAAHVAQRPDLPVIIVMYDGTRVRGKTLGLNRGVDSGMIKINETEVDGRLVVWPFAEIGSSTEAKQGQWCLAAGHPGGYQRERKAVFRVGRVLAKQPTLLISDCPLIGGDSGGPLFDMQGRVIAIHSRIGNSLAANMHVPVDSYLETWDRLVKAEEWGRMATPSPVIGVRGSEAGEARVIELQAGLPADKAGVKVGDVIVKFDGDAITDFDSLKQAVGRRLPGQKVKIVVRRGNETVELTLTVGAARGGAR